MRHAFEDLEYLIPDDVTEAVEHLHRDTFKLTFDSLLYSLGQLFLDVLLELLELRRRLDERNRIFAVIVYYLSVDYYRGRTIYQLTWARKSVLVCVGE
jgi:hypothetical protein